VTADYANWPVGDYLDALASSSPAPGGGSAAAFTGALAASLAEMVCRLSLGRSDEDDGEAQLQAALESAEGLRHRLLRLATEDAVAYAVYLAATGLPKTTAVEKTERRAAMQAALRTAADVPTDIAAACSRIVQALEPIARLGSKHVLSDVEVAVLLAESAARGALANVRVNARLMRDREVADGYLGRAKLIETKTHSVASAVLTIVTQR
jgi:formiminotetrahydrofolate cyclodeaminase